MNLWSYQRREDLLDEAIKKDGVEKLWEEATLGWDELTNSSGYFQGKENTRMFNMSDLNVRFSELNTSKKFTT